jgi:hypothetical protein
MDSAQRTARITWPVPLWPDLGDLTGRDHQDANPAVGRTFINLHWSLRITLNRANSTGATVTLTRI